MVRLSHWSVTSRGHHNEEKFNRKNIYWFCIRNNFWFIIRNNFYSFIICRPIVLFLSFGGDVFLKLIKMLVVPIVFFSLINGVANLQNIGSLGRIGIKSIIIYITTTFLAISISLFFANLFQPGNEIETNFEAII